jgi:hypothetical protein
MRINDQRNIVDAAALSPEGYILEVYHRVNFEPLLLNGLALASDASHVGGHDVEFVAAPQVAARRHTRCSSTDRRPAGTERPSQMLFRESSVSLTGVADQMCFVLE